MKDNKTRHIWDLIEKARPKETKPHDWYVLWRVECLALYPFLQDFEEKEVVIYALTRDHEAIPRFKDIELSDAGLAVEWVTKIELVITDNLNKETVSDSSFVFGLDLTGEEN